MKSLEELLLWMKRERDAADDMSRRSPIHGGYYKGMAVALAGAVQKAKALKKNLERQRT
jgi:hypothetical protein